MSTHRPSRALVALRRCSVALLLSLLAACGGGSVEPAPAPPVVTLQPASSSTSVGRAVTFSVAVTGVGIIFQWQRSVDAGLTWNDLPGANASSYTIVAPDATMNGYQFRVLVRSGDQTVVSDPATLSVSTSTLAGLPYDVAVDATGAVFLAVLPNVQSSSNTWAGFVQTLDPGTGAIRTLAGSTTQGYVNAAGTAAQFNAIENLTGDGHGNVYVSDLGNAVIRKVSADGTVSTFAGNGTVGHTDGPRTAASFVGPRGLTFDAAGNLYVADQFGYNIRKIATDGTVSTLAGGSVSGSADGVGVAARFTGPVGLAFGSDGDLYVADSGTGIRKVTLAGVVTTLTASVSGAVGVAVDSAGNVFATAWSQNQIYKVTPGGSVSVFAGAAGSGSADGDALTARFATPFALAIDATGNILVADTGNHAVRKITPAGLVSTVAR